ncbi:hypothetical protein GCM10010277_73170 [Streptomyces longisporoflavus]|uniref:hypothetical protein n=1 Tax=Streptomyces longisporoflavus TaxID=28044 RepID=UPI00167EAB3D|nr:hypothetical protein [Streptomyces longisporoflavus]GGV65810.1 hypothetical protein GCM10010277_73170 [Streptomyces longisporoflavus]
MTVEESVAELAVHSADVAHENGLKLPWWMDDSWVADHQCQYIKQVYEDLEEPIAFAPEIMESLRDLADPLYVNLTRS